MKTQLLALRGASPVQRSNQGYPRRGSVNNPNFPLALLGLGSPCALASHSRSSVWGARAHSLPLPLSRLGSPRALASHSRSRGWAEPS